MARKFFALSSFAQFIVVALVVILSAGRAQAGEKVILSFNNTEGANPLSTLTPDSYGNLYGTTASGGTHGCGTVFELSPSGSSWTETTLYSFNGCDAQAMTPRGPLTLDSSGNLYGVLQGYLIEGWIFELSRSGNGTWTETIIHEFKPKEGMPNPDLTGDSSGNLYGTTQLDSTGYNGEVFEFSPQSNGTWKETVLYSFPAPDGVGMPVAGVIFDGKGNLYGAAFEGVGGNGGSGAIYELSPPQSGGTWSFTLLFSFAATNGAPSSRLVFDANGNLYGTSDNGPGLYGSIFELLPSAGGTWIEKIIHTFNLNDGYYPIGTPILDAAGNVYGTTISGGSGCNQNSCGVVYKLTPQGKGNWKEAILHPFESATDGSEPGSGLYLDSSGNLYGTTYYGGSRYGYGTVYQITP